MRTHTRNKNNNNNNNNLFSARPEKEKILKTKKSMTTVSKKLDV